MSKVHKIKIQNTDEIPCLDYIRAGSKPVEGRANKSQYCKLKAGDQILFIVEEDPTQSPVLCHITYVNQYKDVKSYLEGEGISRALPWVTTMEEALATYERFYLPAIIEQLAIENDGVGFLGIGVEPMKPVGEN